MITLTETLLIFANLFLIYIAYKVGKLSRFVDFANKVIDKSIGIALSKLEEKNE